MLPFQFLHLPSYHIILLCSTHQTIWKAVFDAVPDKNSWQLIPVFVFICGETGSPSTTLLGKNNDDRFWLLTFNVLRGDVSFSFLCCFLKIAPNSTLLLMPKSMFMLNSYNSLERKKLLKCFHFNFYTFPLITFFCSVARIFNVFSSFSKYVPESPN